MMLNGPIARGPRVRARDLRAIALLTTLAAPALTAQQPIRAVTLAEAIDLSGQVRPNVITAIANRANAEAQRRVATGNYLPSVTGTGNASTLTADGVSRTDPNTGALIPGGSNSKSVRFGVTGSLLLFDGLQRSDITRAANAQLESANAGLADARYEARLVVTNQFFTVLANTQLLRVLDAAVKTAEEQLRQASAKLRAGTATRADSLQSVVSLGTAQSNYATAISNLTSTQATLAQLLGVSGRVTATEDSAYYAPIAALDTVTLMRDAIQSSPQVLNAEAQARAAKANWDASKKAYFPTINLNGSYTFNGAGAQNYQLFNQRQLALALNWSLFNGFQREQTIVNQKSTFEIAQANANDLRHQLEATVIAQLAALTAAQTRIGITGNSVTAGLENLRVQQQRYRLGVATNVDVLTAQQTLNQAQVDAVNARLDYVRARAQIETTVGHTL